MKNEIVTEHSSQNKVTNKQIVLGIVHESRAKRASLIIQIVQF